MTFGQIFDRFKRLVGGRDIYDYANYASSKLALLKGIVWYRFIFAHFGAASWIKRPSQIFGGGNISIGHRVRVEEGAVLYSVVVYSGKIYNGKIVIGDGSYLNRNFNATASTVIELGRDVACGSNVFICDFDHSFENPDISRISSPLIQKGSVHIGDRCWIGANSYIGGGVVLGEGCVVGANSVVTKSFPKNTVIAGAPARALRVLNANVK